MAFQGGIYQPDARSPMDRLYGFQKTQAEMQQLKQKQAMEKERRRILAESYSPESVIPGEVSSPEDADAAMSRLFGMGIPAAGAAPVDHASLPSATPIVKPASFNREGAIDRLYGAGDIEGGNALVDGQYKQAMGARAAGGGTEKWSKTGRIIRDPKTGEMFSQVQSDFGNSKLIPLDGELVGQNQVIKAGGKSYIKDAYTGETREVIDSTMTPGEAADNDPVLQAELTSAKTAAREKAESGAKADLAAEKAGPVIDKTISIVDELLIHPGRKWGTGATSIWASSVPGTPAYDFKVKLEQLAGQTFLSEVEKMRGLGTLTETEGKKLSSAAAALKAAQSEPEFERQLRRFRSELDFYRGKAAKRMESSSPPARETAAQYRAPTSPAGAPARGAIKGGYVFMGGNPADPKAWRKL